MKELIKPIQGRDLDEKGLKLVESERELQEINNMLHESQSKLRQTQQESSEKDIDVQSLRKGLEEQ